jgi:ERCC4-type nuclease
LEGIYLEILIDDREKKSRIQKAIEYFQDEQGDTVKVDHLEIGDYIINNEVVFEYKRLDDFVKSVKERRVFNQAVDQSVNFKYHFVVVVSTDRQRRAYFSKATSVGFKGGYFDETQYIGSLSRLNTYTTVIQADYEKQAFKYMRAQARKCLDNKHVVKRLETKTDNPAFNWLMNIKHISDKKAELIVNELKLETLTDLLTITSNDLQAIPSIGSATAEIILNSIK